MHSSRAGVLVYLYGPPASGKLTVAETLRERTGFRLFHNHLTVDALTPVLERRSEEFSSVLHRLRLDVFEKAAASGTDVIFTNNSAWGGTAARERFARFASQARHVVASQGGETIFVQLLAGEESLHRRLANESRHAHGKLLDPVRLDELLATHDPAPLHADDLVIDTDQVEPSAAAELVVTAIEARRPRTRIDGSRLAELRSIARFNGLAAMQVAAGCVLHDHAGRILIVDPVYKDRWELPGGAVEPAESPFDACRREVAEELSLEITPRRLLCVDHQTMRPPRRDALRFVFDGGRIDDRSIQAIRLDPHELRDWKLVPFEELDHHLRDTVANRVRRGLRSPGIYLENGTPLSG